MLKRPEAGDPAVEELKRRARRRLVGAIVLALAAAVILPLLLESDPKPLGDDVSIRIPPIDNSRFITPLSPAKAPDAKSTGPDTKAAPPATSPAAPVKPPEPAPESAVDSKPVGATGANEPKVAEREAVVATQAPSAEVAQPSAGAQPRIVGANPATNIAPATTSAHAATAAGSFVVQVAAFTDAKAAPPLAAKLKSAGYPVYIDTLKTPKGAMKRVRTGPYATRDAAAAALDKLKAAGYRGVVTTK